MRVCVWYVACAVTQADCFGALPQLHCCSLAPEPVGSSWLLQGLAAGQGFCRQGCASVTQHGSVPLGVPVGQLAQLQGLGEGRRGGGC